MADSIVGGHNIQLGFVGGDVTILLDSPDYRVEFVPASSAEVPQSPSRDRPGNRPSYLLDPRHQVVPYRSRLDEEARLREWLEDREKQISVLLLVGPAGQGKTRLAGHVASVLHREGWAIAQAIPHGRERGEAGAVRANTLIEDQSLLVVVDYAERWHQDSLAHLVSSVAEDFKPRHCRVLMLSRQGESVWETISSELDQIKVSTGQKQEEDEVQIDLANPIILGEFTSDRAAAFTDAVAAFTGRIGSPSRPRQPPPPNLADPAYASPLTLHMAALATVYAAATGDAVPDHRDPNALSRYLLHHERRYWNATSTGPMGTREVPALLIEDAVWWATLFGPVPGHRSAIELLQRAGLADGRAEADELLRIYERLYPPVRAELSDREPGRQYEVATLIPLQPDRLGEDFVGGYFATHPHAVEKIADIADAARDAEDAAGMLDFRRCLIVLAAAASRHQAAARALCALLGQQPELAVHGGATVVQFVADQTDSDLANAVCATLPMHEAKRGPRLPKYDADLLRPAADLAQRIVSELPAGAPPELRADRLLHLGNRLAHLGRHDEAFAAISEAAENYRRAANAGFDYQPCLAVAMASLLNARILKLMARHVLRTGEEVTRVRLWPDGLALTTSLRHFVAGPEPGDWLAAREEWVDDVVMAIRDDIIIEGPDVAGRHGFLLLADGGEVYVNDPDAMAELGRRVWDGMNPVAYAQLLAQFHSGTLATCEVLTEPGELRRRFARADLPDNEPFRLSRAGGRTAEGLVLTFHAFIRYRWLAGATLLDITAWTVHIPVRGRAEWKSRLIAKRLPLGL